MPSHTKVPPFALAGLLLAAFVHTGCTPPDPVPPRTVAQLDEYQRGRSQDFTLRLIVLHNINRVLQGNLPAEERVESMRVIEKLDLADAESYAALASVLTNASTPQPVRLAVLAYLIRKDQPDLASHVGEALPHTTDPAARSTILDYLQKHPTPAVLAETIKLWAADKARGGENEIRYRNVVENLSGTTWEKALLEKLNSDEPFPRGSAIEVLASRLPPAELRKRIEALPAQSEAVYALQYFLARFEYLPGTRREFYAASVLYHSGNERLARAAELARKWQTQHGYAFNIRDYHLVSRLAADPLRNMPTHAQLATALFKSITDRKGPRPPGKADIRNGKLMDFDSQVSALTLADLWNLTLLNEMLARQRVREGILMTAEQYRASRQMRRGGLVSYDQGQAEPRLYPPEARGGEDQYAPTERMMQDSVDALCFFVGHFEQLPNDAAQAGPTTAELRLAKESNLCGLILTSLAGDRLSAIYLNPDGITIDLGEYRLGK